MNIMLIPFLIAALHNLFRLIMIYNGHNHWLSAELGRSYLADISLNICTLHRQFCRLFFGRTKNDRIDDDLEFQKIRKKSIF